MFGGLSELAVVTSSLRRQHPAPPRDFAIFPLLRDIPSIAEHDMQVIAHSFPRSAWERTDGKLRLPVPSGLQLREC